MNNNKKLGTSSEQAPESLGQVGELMSKKKTQYVLWVGIFHYKSRYCVRDLEYWR